MRNYPGLALVEVAIGVSGLLVSVASFAGRMRKPVLVTESFVEPLADPAGADLAG